MANKQKYTQAFFALESSIRENIPQYRRRVKDSSRLMRAINMVVGRFNDSFMEFFTTTIGYTVYFPRSLYDDHFYSLEILAHEYVHLLRTKKLGRVLHGMLYLFPQWLGLLSLLSFGVIFGGGPWIVWLYAFVFFSPIPAYFRMREELDAYTMSMGVEYWERGKISLDTKEDIAKNFTGGDYYYMWPFKAHMRKLIEARSEAIIAGKYDAIKPYREVRVIIEANLKD